jgi:hypothetical protein
VFSLWDFLFSPGKIRRLTVRSFSQNPGKFWN